MDALHSLLHKFASSNSSRVLARYASRSKNDFTNILRRTFSLSALFLSSLHSRKSAHLPNRKVLRSDSHYLRVRFAFVPAVRHFFYFLQEVSVPRFGSPVSPATADPRHSQLLPVLLAGVLACVLLLVARFTPWSTQPRAALTPGSLLHRLAQAPPALAGDLAHSFFASPAALALPSSPSAPGTLNGRVTYDGTPMKLKPINMSAEPNCAKFYTTPVMPEVSLTGPDKSLQNVIVYISAGAPDENFAGPVVRINQRGCRYTPHIVAVQVNQEVWVQNDDAVTHSVHPMAHSNAEWNRSQPPGTPPVVIRYSQPEFIRVKCELHPWMRGVLAVFKNSHHAVSDSTGAFTLPELPPGKYTVTAWHEVYGTQSKEITIAPGQNADLNFVFKVTPY
jgi:plastocyanin